MIRLHPEFITKEGNTRFAVLPYDEYLQLTQLVARAIEKNLEDPRYGGFWDNLSAEELARRQGVGPVTDLSSLAWPFGAEDWEGFDEAVDEWRHGPAAI